MHTARIRIVQRKAVRPRNNAPQDANHQLPNIVIIGDLNELVQIRAMKNMLAQCRTMENDIEAMATGWDSRLYYLAKGAQCAMVDKKDTALLQLSEGVPL